MENLGELWQKGGPFMFALLVCSVCIAMISIERWRFYRQARQGMATFHDRLANILQHNTTEKALQLLAAESSAGATLAYAGLSANLKGEDVALALDVAYGDLAMKLRARLNYLSMFVTMAPLLGLLGTIAGMIQSFSIFNLRAGEPLAITGGIGEALIATATGLCVAIFALVVHTYFAQKLDEILTFMDVTSLCVRSHLLITKEGIPHAS